MSETALVCALGGIFAMLFLLPFLPGLAELLRPRDDKPLAISWDLVKDPLYFYHAFRRKIYGRLGSAGRWPVRGTLSIFDDETVELHPYFAAWADRTHENLIFSYGKLRAGKNSVFLKEAYAAGDASVGEGSTLRALAADGSIRLGGGSRVRRWIGSGGNISAGPGCDLGVSAACCGKITLGEGCRFRTLYAAEIRTVPPPGFPPGRMIQKIDLEKYRNILHRRMQAIEMQEGMVIPVDILARGQLRLGDDTRSTKSIKSHSNLIVGHGSVIEGGLFSEGDIIIGMNCRIGGNVFSQGEVIIYPNTTVGRPGAVKSVIGKKSLLLSMNVAIYGQARTEGRGGVVL